MTCVLGIVLNALQVYWLQTWILLCTTRVRNVPCIPGKEGRGSLPRDIQETEAQTLWRRPWGLQPTVATASTLLCPHLLCSLRGSDAYFHTCTQKSPSKPGSWERHATPSPTSYTTELSEWTELLPPGTTHMRVITSHCPSHTACLFVAFPCSQKKLPKLTLVWVSPFHLLFTLTGGFSDGANRLSEPVKSQLCLHLAVKKEPSKFLCEG